MSAIRFGYGIRPGEEVPDGPEALLAQLRRASSEPVRFPHEGIEGRRDTIREYYSNMRSARDPDPVQRRKNQRPFRLQAGLANVRDQHERMLQSAFSPLGFHERLVTFWADHFSVNSRKGPEMRLYCSLYEAEALRPNISGPFVALLKAAIVHPAMLIYLDQNRSQGPNSRRAQQTGKGLNENLGRELLELHTLGVDGGYTQKDVIDAALMLTGLGVINKEAAAGFRPLFAEPGPLTFMGKTYGGRRRSLANIEEMLDDLAAMPQTARHICRKLVVHFISDNPPEPLITTMVDAWNKSGGDLFEVYRAMLNHPAAWENPLEKARQPYDFVVAGLRALDVPAAALGMPDRSDQEDKTEDAPMAPPVAKTMEAPEAGDGEQQEMQTPEMQTPEMQTPEMQATEMKAKEPAKAQMATNRLHNRFSIGAVHRLGQPVWDPTNPSGFEEGFESWITSAQITGRIEWAQSIASQFGARLSPDAFVKTILRDAVRDDTLRIVSQAPNKPAGIALALASPEFNRR